MGTARWDYNSRHTSLEIVEALLAGKPLRRAHRAIGKALARLGVVTEINPVGGGVEHDLVHAHDIAFAKGSDLQILLRPLAAGFADHALDGDRRSRGRIFLVSVVPLEDLSGVLVLQGCSRGARDVEEQIHSHGEVRRVNEVRAVALDQLPDSIYFSIPACGADHHVLARADDRLRYGRRRRREW